MKRPVFTLVLFTLLANLAFSSPAPGAYRLAEQTGTVEKFLRTELYFGRNIPSGGTVDEAEWRRFLDEEVTPRFPGGLTVLEARGQWRSPDGSLSREESKVLILFYPRRLRKAIHQRIEEIRSEYKKRFRQESVLRIDSRSSVRATF